MANQYVDKFGRIRRVDGKPGTMFHPRSKQSRELARFARERIKKNRTLMQVFAEEEERKAELALLRDCGRDGLEWCLMGPDERKRARRLEKRGLLEPVHRAQGNSLTKYRRASIISREGRAFLEEHS